MLAVISSLAFASACKTEHGTSEEDSSNLASRSGSGVTNNFCSDSNGLTRISFVVTKKNNDFLLSEVVYTESDGGQGGDDGIPGRVLPKMTIEGCKPIRWQLPGAPPTPSTAPYGGFVCQSPKNKDKLYKFSSRSGEFPSPLKKDYDSEFMNSTFGINLVLSCKVK